MGKKPRLIFSAANGFSSLSKNGQYLYTSARVSEQGQGVAPSKDEGKSELICIEKEIFRPVSGAARCAPAKRDDGRRVERITNMTSILRR